MDTIGTGGIRYQFWSLSGQDKNSWEVPTAMNAGQSNDSGFRGPGAPSGHWPSAGSGWGVA